MSDGSWRVLPLDDRGMLSQPPFRREAVEDYVGTGGYALAKLGAGSPWRSFPDRRAELIAQLRSTGLVGRGGAAFPTWRKIAATVAAAETAGMVPVVVANGAEGEPLSAKDRYLQRYRPHLVLEGLLVAMEAVGSDLGYVYAADPASQSSIERALHEAEDRGVAVPTVRCVRAQDTYVAGEETAAVRAIDTGIARPVDKPPRPFESGVGGRPTLVLNVETLACVALHLRHPTRSPSLLATLSGRSLRPHLVELPLGAPLKDVLGLLPAEVGVFEHVVLGGFFGGIVPVTPELDLDRQGLAALGTSLGCAAMRVLDAAECPVTVAADIAAYFRDNNARQCGTCMRTTGGVAAELARLAAPGSGDEALPKLTRWAAAAPGAGACAVPDGARVLIRCLIRHYGDLLHDHGSRGCTTCEAAHHAETGATLPRWDHLRVELPQWGGVQSAAADALR